MQTLSSRSLREKLAKRSVKVLTRCVPYSRGFLSVHIRVVIVVKRRKGTASFESTSLNELEKGLASERSFLLFQQYREPTLPSLSSKFLQIPRKARCPSTPYSAAINPTLSDVFSSVPESYTYTVDI